MVVSARSSRATVVSLGVAFLLVLSGCASVRGLVSDERPRIGYVLSNTSGLFAKELGSGFVTAAQNAGVDASVVGPRVPNATEQVEQFKELTTTAKGGIAVSVTARDLFILPLAEATASGIPVLVSAGAPVPGSGVKLLVENDNYDLGRMMVDEVIKRLPAEATGKIVLGADVITHPVIGKRAKGIRDTFARERPNIQVVGPLDTHRDQVPNLEVWRSLMASNPDALAFVGMGDTDTVNLASLPKGTSGGRLTGGFSGQQRAVQGVKDGSLFATVSPEQFLKGACTGWMLAMNAKGDRPLPEGWLATPGLAVTSDNVDAVIQRQSSQQLEMAFVQPQIDRIMDNPFLYLRGMELAE